MEDADIYAIGGDSAFSADFADGTVSTRLDLTGQNVSTGVLRPFGVFDGGGTLTGTSSAFEGSMGSSSSTYSGVFNGAFFGPGAREMGYTFELINGVNGVAVGAVVGHQ